MRSEAYARSCSSEENRVGVFDCGAAKVKVSKKLSVGEKYFGRVTFQ